MIKSLVLFIVFFVVDIVSWVLMERNNAMSYFFPLIFLEIAIYGSVIIYDIAKFREKSDKDNKDNNSDKD